MSLLRSISTVIFILSVPVALATLNVRYAFNEDRLWTYGFERYQSDLRSGLPMSEVERSAAELRAYFNDDSERFNLKVLRDGQSVDLFSDREVEHLVDVKDLVQNVYRAQAIALGFCLVYVVSVFVWAREMPVRALAYRVMVAAIATLGLLIAFGSVAAVGFDSLWTRFHRIAFTNNLWQLDPATDRLIQMFPEPFWQDTTFFVAFLTVFESGLLFTISFLYLRATRTTVGEPDEDLDDEDVALVEPA